jgi:hypothetical protein
MDGEGNQLVAKAVVLLVVALLCGGCANDNSVTAAPASTQPSAARPAPTTPATPAPTVCPYGPLADHPGCAPPPAATPTPATVCSVHYLNHDANAWVYGPDAISYCRGLALQDANWLVSTVPEGGDYVPGGGSPLICQGSRGTSQYEVYDTGGHTLGDTACRWLNQRFAQ